MLNIEIIKKMMKLFQIISFNRIKNSKNLLNLVINSTKYTIFEALHLYPKSHCL